MAKKRSDDEESTSITSRIDIVAKKIIKRSNLSYREVLEEAAYSSITEENKDELISKSKKEITNLEKDLTDLSYFKKQNVAKIQDLELELQKCQEMDKRFEKIISRKENRLTTLHENLEKLEEIITKYENTINYNVDDAVAKVEEVLKHNHELRERGPRARVKESDIKVICNDFKVTVKEVLPNIDPKYLDCMEGYQKYI